MIVVYRLHSSRYTASSGQGAAINGGRWNPKGIPVIYASASPSLAALEVLVHYAVLPKGFVLTSISIPGSVLIADVPEAALTDGWDDPEPIAATQEYGRRWVESKESSVLRVPSTVIKAESNYIINVLHPDFPKMVFGQPDPFRFDPRLK
jgi:RES domain-containing protein